MVNLNSIRNLFNFFFTLVDDVDDNVIEMVEEQKKTRTERNMVPVEYDDSKWQHATSEKNTHNHPRLTD
ncbi:hypothetical protein DERF_008673 [Dermatophagoides farinae]|uniref:Uncharacterized protein n=1 Tax=Dermatophagoides farinae TaxID=6954 RepID=A0A922I2W1_DERFA|nr:hypothetical protein DERF_008673 [Dermatophagoides farinae]